MITIFVLYTLLSSYGGIYVNIINGLGKIRLQIYLMLFAALVNIPLSVVLVRYFGFGIEGVKLGTLFSLVPLWLMIPMQVFKIIYNQKGLK